MYGDLGGIEQTYYFDAALGLRVPTPAAQFGSVRISAQGFRSPPVPMPKPAGTIRLAFLGGSTTFCAEVSDETLAWPHLVTDALRQHYAHVDFDYINAGVPGFGVGSAQQYLEKRVAEFDPDVIIVYEATNDLSSNSYDVANSFGLVARRTEQDLSWLSQYSMLSYLVEKNLLVLQLQSQVEETTGRLLLTPDIVESIVAPFRRDLTELIRSSQRVAPLVAVVTFAARIRANQTAEEQSAAAVTSLYYMPYMTVAGLIEAFAAYNDTISDVTTNLDALLIAQDSTIPGDGDHYVDSVHFTDLGSRAMARRVTDGLVGSAKFQQLIATRAK
jgi:lysophospholipase L1-like esterase